MGTTFEQSLLDLHREANEAHFLVERTRTLLAAFPLLGIGLVELVALDQLRCELAVALSYLLDAPMLDAAYNTAVSARAAIASAEATQNGGDRDDHKGEG